MKRKRKPRKPRRSARPRRGSPAAHGYSLPHADDPDSLVCRDEDLARGLDMVKFRYATYVSEHEPGRSKLARKSLAVPGPGPSGGSWGAGDGSRDPGKLGRATPEVLAGLWALAEESETLENVRRAAREALEWLEG